MLGLSLSQALTSVQAQVVLQNKNSTASINTANQAGMFNWTVDGFNQLAQQWFWYRVGPGGPEQAINTISPAVVVQPNARTAYITYNNGAYSVEVDYLLTGFATGSRNSDISETIRISNNTAAPLDFHFFQYSDFTLAGAVGGSSVQLGQDIYGKYNEADITRGSSTISETVVSPGANHGEAAFYNSTLTKLNDAAPTTLNDNVGPVGPGPADATWAFEWDFTIAPGASLGISKDKYLHWDPVPEPTSVALLVGGLVAARLYRRKTLA